jgi:hypothetical protein
MSNDNTENSAARFVMPEGCMSCFFCRDIVTDEDGDETGTCKRFPPVLSPMSKEQQDDFETDLDGNWSGRYEHDIVPWVQPRVYSEAWCGEYRARSEA